MFHLETQKKRLNNNYQEEEVVVIIRINVYFICLDIYFGIRGEKITILTMNKNIYHTLCY